MATQITPEFAEQVANKIEEIGVSEETIQQLRQHYPNLHFTYCLDDDIGRINPVLERSLFNLYLVDSSEHCLKLTRTFETATGFVLAEVIRDDD